MPEPTPSAAQGVAANPALCASASARLVWAAGALLLLWGSVFWALA